MCRVSQELGKSKKYLDRIATVATELKLGTSLSENALNTMQQDFITHKQLYAVSSDLEL